MLWVRVVCHRNRAASQSRGTGAMCWHPTAASASLRIQPDGAAAGACWQVLVARGRIGNLLSEVADEGCRSCVSTASAVSTSCVIIATCHWLAWMLEAVSRHRCWSQDMFKCSSVAEPHLWAWIRPRTLGRDSLTRRCQEVFS